MMSVMSAISHLQETNYNSFLTIFGKEKKYASKQILRFLTISAGCKRFTTNELRYHF